MRHQWLVMNPKLISKTSSRRALKWPVLLFIYDGVRWVSGLRKEPKVSVENPTLIPTSHSLPREGRDHLFQWDVGISVGFSKCTTGFLRNHETRRCTPSYVHRCDLCCDHDGVSVLHVLEHEDPEVEVVDQWIGVISPRLVGRQSLQGLNISMQIQKKSLFILLAMIKQYTYSCKYLAISLCNVFMWSRYID